MKGNDLPSQDGKMVRSREQVLEILRKYKERNHERLQFVKIGVFGSAAKDSFTDKSDVDIVVDHIEPDLYILASIKDDLENDFGRKVDIFRFRNEMNIFLKKRIEREAVYV
jgi:uncharacterized protein